MSPADSGPFDPAHPPGERTRRLPPGWELEEGDDVEAINRLFTPEFRNRLDAIIPFGSLPVPDVAAAASAWWGQQIGVRYAHADRADHVLAHIFHCGGDGWRLRLGLRFDLCNLGHAFLLILLLTILEMRACATPNWAASASCVIPPARNSRIFLTSASDSLALG